MISAVGKAAFKQPVKQQRNHKKALRIYDHKDGNGMTFCKWLMYDIC